MEKIRAQLEVLSIAGKAAPADTMLTVESDTDHPHLIVLRWPGGPPITVFWPEVEQAVAKLKRGG